MDSNRLIREALDTAARTGKPAWDSTMVVLLSQLATVGHLMSPVPRSALETASRVWNDPHADRALLTEAKVRCWRYLDGRSNRPWPLDRDERLTRAVLCVLEPTEDGDTVWFFCEMMEGVEQGAAT